MYQDTSDVKSKQKVVGQVTVTVYETVEELVTAVDEKVILDMFNKANKIAAQAKERQAHAPTKIGKNLKMKLAMNKLTADEMISCQGDFDALEALAMTKLPEVEADLAVQAGAEVVEEVVETE